MLSPGHSLPPLVTESQQVRPRAQNAWPDTGTNSGWENWNRRHKAALNPLLLICHEGGKAVSWAQL